MLRKITESPYLDLLSGLILPVSPTYQTIATLGQASVGVHHGILVFSIIQIAKAIPELMHGLSEVEEADEIFE